MPTSRPGLGVLESEWEEKQESVKVTPQKPDEGLMQAIWTQMQLRHQQEKKESKNGLEGDLGIPTLKKKEKEVGKELQKLPEEGTIKKKRQEGLNHIPR